MYKIIVPLFSLLLLVTACNNDCQDLLDNVTTTKASYETSATAPNCVAYQSALQAYLSSSCEGDQGVNYDAIFQSYLDDLQCDSLPNSIPTCLNGVQDAGETGVDCGGPNCTPCAASTCTDGIQNGTETGVDCGGTCAPCSNAGNLFIAFTLNGIDYNWDSFLTTGGSGCCTNGYGDINSAAENSTYIAINFFDIGRISLDTIQTLINQPIHFDESVDENYANLDFELNGASYDTRYGINTSSTSSFTVTSASLYNSQVIFGDTIENYLVEGTFNALIEGAGDTSAISAGSFRLIFGNL